MTQSDDIVIRAQGLGKRYALGAKKREGGYVALRDVAASAAQSLWRKRGALLSRQPRVEAPAPGDFWALKDVNFEIRRGEVVGIIGRNGAGKSTLLKILSRITEPTEGRVEIRGRVASLLEVGTGFHPELTGRENIALNGAILGMTQAEIRRKFDEIVAFAEVEKFLDTPVKRYSSGMYVRLAFAVAAHLEPEILIVDEVLAVGDAEFQKKCLGKMQDVAGHGRTVLFVSHNMAAVQSLCSRGIVLAGGGKVFDGGAHESIQAYQAGGGEYNAVMDLEGKQGASDDIIKILGIRVYGEKGDARLSFMSSEPFYIEVAYEITSNDQAAPRINLHFDTDEGTAFASIDPTKTTGLGKKLSTLKIEGNFLNARNYRISLYASTLNPSQVNACLLDLIQVEIHDDLNSPVRQGYLGRFPGAIRPMMFWSSKCEIE
jgi:lipopolysaccharide transport system ATP-binding protein